MNSKTLLASIFLVTLAGPTLAKINIGSAESALVNITPGRVHVPLGFDANDNIEVVVTGTLPDTCYRRPMGDVQIKGNNIDITMLATRVSGKIICIKAVVPYLVSVPLGQLPAGNYDITINPKDASSLHNSLPVANPGSSSIDNFTYANVTNLKMKDEGGLVIEGSHPSSCMDITRVDVVPNDAKDTFSVLPIVEQNNENCDRSMKPFSHPVSMPAMDHKVVVFHVRKIDGTAVNFMMNENIIISSNLSKQN